MPTTPAEPSRPSMPTVRTTSTRRPEPTWDGMVIASFMNWTTRLSARQPMPSRPLRTCAIRFRTISFSMPWYRPTFSMPILRTGGVRTPSMHRICDVARWMPHAIPAAPCRMAANCENSRTRLLAGQHVCKAITTNISVNTAITLILLPVWRPTARPTRAMTTRSEATTKTVDAHSPR